MSKSFVLLLALLVIGGSAEAKKSTRRSKPQPKTAPTPSLVVKPETIPAPPKPGRYPDGTMVLSPQQDAILKDWISGVMREATAAKASEERVRGDLAKANRFLDKAQKSIDELQSALSAALTRLNKILTVASGLAFTAGAFAGFVLALRLHLNILYSTAAATLLGGLLAALTYKFL